MATRLSCGGVTFADFEIPERMPFGGKHIISKHVMLGGRRVVDAMGPDPAPLSWGGRFRGSNALSRAKQLNTMAAAGRQVPVTFAGLTYLVIITDFNANMEQVYEIPYTITCEVVTDTMQAVLGGLAAGLGSVVSGDLSSALSNVTGSAASLLSAGIPSITGGAVMSMDGMTSAITGLQGAMAGAAPLAGASSQTLLGLASSASGVSQSLGASQGALEGLLSAVPVVGSDPAGMASWVQSTVANLSQQSAVLDTKPYVDRVAINLNTGVI